MGISSVNNNGLAFEIAGSMFNNIKPDAAANNSETMSVNKIVDTYESTINNQKTENQNSRIYSDMGASVRHFEHPEIAEKAGSSMEEIVDALQALVSEDEDGSVGVKGNSDNFSSKFENILKSSYIDEKGELQFGNIDIKS